MRGKIYLDRLEELIISYDHSLPFAIYLRQEFNKRRNMGARDRRRTRDDAYSFYRIGLNLQEMGFMEKLAIAVFLCQTESNEERDFLLQNHSPFQPEDLKIDLHEKISRVQNHVASFSLEKLFPLHGLLSSRVAKEEFIESFLIQPSVFIRVKSGFTSAVLSELDASAIQYNQYTERANTFSFPSATALSGLKSFELGYFELQDLNSQKCIEGFQVASGELWWDACAASGGKTLALLDQHPGIRLWSSDIRESSLKNLRLRTGKAKLIPEKIFQMDVSNEITGMTTKFDGIIADVPCSGSGTWSRTPEMLSSFDQKKIFDDFVPLQKKIVTHLTKQLLPGKSLIYITCSAFAEENEKNVEYFVEKTGLKCISDEYFEGAFQGADTMYRAILQKPE